LDNVSEISGQRRRRSDAERSATAVLDAAVRVLGRHPEATVEEVAAAAGVTRQTVYAHYPSRPLLVAAVIDRITADVVAALDAAIAGSDTVTEALLSWLDVTWQLSDRYPLARHPSAAASGPADAERQHEPVFARLEPLIRRGQSTGEIDDTVSAAWLVSATVALGHAAGAEVAADRMTSDDAAATLRHSILRLFGPRTGQRPSRLDHSGRARPVAHDPVSVNAPSLVAVPPRLGPDCAPGRDRDERGTGRNH
jgi:AcrR family transcriptional regulator